MVKSSSPSYNIISLFLYWWQRHASLICIFHILADHNLSYKRYWWLLKQFSWFFRIWHHGNWWFGPARSYKVLWFIMSPISTKLPFVCPNWMSNLGMSHGRDVPIPPLSSNIMIRLGDLPIWPLTRSGKDLHTAQQPSQVCLHFWLP